MMKSEKKPMVIIDPALRDALKIHLGEQPFNKVAGMYQMLADARIIEVTFTNNEEPPVNPPPAE